MGLPSTAAPPLLTDLLEQVSRSFYLTLRLMPTAVRPQLGLGYLLARTSDTIADTEIVPLAERLGALDQLRQRILGRQQGPLAFGALINRQSNPAERALLERVEEALAMLGQFSEADRQLLREVLSTITSGQELDLRRFAGASPKDLRALQTDEDLDDYTYRVAGCVGEFWTKMCRAHLFPQARVEDRLLLAQGVRFGKGLQLVNLLRDLPQDLRQGRCYFPAQRLGEHHLQPADLLDVGNEKRLRPLYQQYLDRAREHLAAGWEYTNALPFGQWRVRMACALPILIGIKTLAKLRVNPILAPGLRIKVTRAELRGLAIRMVVWYLWPKTWKRLPARLERRAEQY